MAHERAGEERDAGFRAGIVAELPGAAVERIEILRAAGDHADRQAAADDLAVRRDVGAHAEQRLRAARMHAETGDDFVEDQRGVAFAR